MLHAGAIVADHLRLVRQLGSGGMGSVWVAEQTRLGGLVAVKFLATALLDHESARSRFDREARLAAKIKSQHVVQIHDHGLTKGDPSIPYIVMELLEGIDLSKLLDRDGPVGLARAAEILDQISDALTKAHEAGIVHRDIKPENVFVLDEPRTFIKLLDFGVAHGRDGQIDRLTQTGLLLGTAHYMSPEQLFSGKDIDARADLWALGILTYQVLTNEVPFQAETFGQLCLQVRDGSFPPVSSKVNVPPALDGWFTKALSTDRNQRFQSAREMAAAFREVMAGGQVVTTATASGTAAQTNTGTGTVKVDKSEVSRLKEEILRANSGDYRDSEGSPHTRRFGSQHGLASNATEHATGQSLRESLVNSRDDSKSFFDDGAITSDGGDSTGGLAAGPIANNTPLADLSGSFGTEAKGVLALDPRSGSTSRSQGRWIAWVLAALALGTGVVYFVSTRSSGAQAAADGGPEMGVPPAPSVLTEVVASAADRSLIAPSPSAAPAPIALHSTIPDAPQTENEDATGKLPSTIEENAVTGRAIPATPTGSLVRNPKTTGVNRPPKSSDQSSDHASSDKPSVPASTLTPSPAPHPEPTPQRKPKYRGF